MSADTGLALWIGGADEKEISPLSHVREIAVTFNRELPIEA